MNSRHSRGEQEFRRGVCPFPWTSLLVDCDGSISFCCWHYPFAHINDVSENATDEIWNSKIAQDLRRRWNEGRLEGTPCGNCAGLNMFQHFPYPIQDMPAMPGDIYANVQLNIAEFTDGKTVLKSMPVEIQYVPSTLCNIHCIHCYQRPVRKDNNSYIKSKDLLNFYHRLGNRAAKNWFVGGEPLYIRQTFQLINEFSPEQRAASEAVFCTNGLLAKDKFQSIAGFRKYVFLISISSFRKETYEYIHHGASFEKLIENLEFLSQRKFEGMDISLIRQMVVMKSNFVDLMSISSAAKRYKFDEVWVKPVHGAYWKGDILKDENIFQLPHLLKNMPDWKDIIAKASQDVLDTDNKTTYNNLQYLNNQLSSSTVLSRLHSICNLFSWQLRVTIIKLMSLIPLNRRKKLMLTLNRLLARLRSRSSGETA